MRIAILSDIHGNNDALSAVIEDAERKRVDHYLLLGDIFSFGPSPNEVLNIVESLPIINSIIGNHDQYLRDRIFLNPSKKIMGQSVTDPSLKILIECEEWCMDNIGQKGDAYLSRMQTLHSTQINNERILFVHATPGDVESAPSKETIFSMLELADQYNCSIYVSGHTHIPHSIRINGKHFINPGSVGLPWDGNKRASYCIINLDDEELTVEYTRVKYNIKHTINQLIQRKVPYRDITIKRLEQASLFPR